ncbi:unnamed protein product, partial [marine sediment metagenome]
MPANLAFLRLYYSVREEVLESGMWYFNATAGSTLNTLVAREFVDEFYGRMNAFNAVLGAGTRIYAVEGNWPLQDGAGPFSYQRTQ